MLPVHSPLKTSFPNVVRAASVPASPSTPCPSVNPFSTDASGEAADSSNPDGHKAEVQTRNEEGEKRYPWLPKAESLELRLPGLQQHSRQRIENMFTDRKLLNEGAQGKLYLAEAPRLAFGVRPRKVVCKIPRRCGLPDSDRDAKARQGLMREATLLHMLAEVPGVARMHSFIQEADTKNLLLALDLVPGFDLFDLIIKNPYNLEPTVLQKFFWPVAKQLLDVLVALQQRGIAHRDLRPENVMMTPRWIDRQGPQTSSNLEGFTVTLIDFGLAGIVKPDAYANWGAEDPSGMMRTLLTTDMEIRERQLGTAFITPPELFRGQYHSPADLLHADLFAAGVTLYFYAFGELEVFEEWQTLVWERPVYDLNKDPRRALALTFLERGFTPAGEQIDEFLYQLTQCDPDRRPSLSWAVREVSKHM